LLAIQATRCPRDTAFSFIASKPAPTKGSGCMNKMEYEDE